MHFVAFLCLHFCDTCACVSVLLPSSKYVRAFELRFVSAFLVNLRGNRTAECAGVRVCVCTLSVRCVCVFRSALWRVPVCAWTRVYGRGVWRVSMSGAGVCGSVERSFARTCTVLGGEFLPRYPCRFFVVLFCFND